MSGSFHRRPKGVLGVAIAALAVLALAAPIAAPAYMSDAHGVIGASGEQVTRPASVNARGTDVAAVDQQVQSPVVNARGTDVAAVDQQVRNPVVNARGTDVAAVDQQVPRGSGDPVAPAAPVAASDDTMPTVVLMGLIALALAGLGLGLAAWLAASRKRTRAVA
jgi:hypothetical protein